MSTATQPEASRPWNARSLGLIFLAWFTLQFAGLFSPPLLDDVDSVYIEIAREMLHRHDFVTPYIDGIRFFDKPPLMYWLAAGSMRLLGEHDWAARLPLALAFLALLIAIYALGQHFNGTHENSDRGALYASLIFATSLGPWLYSRFFIPDLLICLWMTLGVHTFLIALSRAAKSRMPLHYQAAGETAARGVTPPITASPSPLLPTLAFAATLALNLLTKGLIGLVFPLAFVFLYLLITRQFRLAARLPLLPALLTFLAIALPWHILAAINNPAVSMPAGQGLPARAGWAWFYLYNEHIARFLGRRIPHDYGNTPVWLFWLYAVLWMFPWTVFLPAAVARTWRQLGHRFQVTVRDREAALAITLWSLTVLTFFTLSSRQEYYSLPALPALALMLGGLLAAAGHGVPQDDRPAGQMIVDRVTRPPTSSILWLHRWFLLPLTGLIALVCLFFALTAPHTPAGTDLAALLSQNPDLYNLSLGHLFDLTGPAMGLFRGPLFAVAAGMLLVGLGSYLLRRRQQNYAANLTLAAGAVVVLLAAHTGLVRFNPILGSEPLAAAILTQESARPQSSEILLDGELTSGSTLLFYTRQPVHLVNGRVNGPWFGSFWPDAPAIFEDDSSLHRLWASPTRIFLLTYAPAARSRDLAPYGSVRTLASVGGKTILTNR